MRHAHRRGNARRPRVDRRQLCSGFQTLAERVPNDPATAMYLPKIPLRFPKASAPKTDHTGFEFGHMPMDNSIIESFNGTQMRMA
jgi:hypothetical protein